MEPETIIDQPIPLLGEGTNPSSGSNSAPSVGSSTPIPDIQADRKFVPKVIAVETIGQSINTQTRTILGQYTFESLGAISIGTYVNGVSGSIQISPDGVIATNSDGEVTFTLDGVTGDATFAGTIQSGSVISGDITVGGANNGSGQIHVLDGSNIEAVLIDKDGIVIYNGQLAIYNAADSLVMDASGIVSSSNFTIHSASGGPFTTFSNTSYATVPGTSTVSFTLTRSVKAFIILSIVGSSEQVNSGLACSGRTHYRIFSTNGGELTDFFYDSAITMTGFSIDWQENIISKPYLSSGGIVLNAGAHTINVQAMISSVINFRSTLNTYDLSIIVLGT